MNKYECHDCGEEVPHRRWDELKVFTCLKCGEDRAKKVMTQTFKRVMPAGNKGGIMLIGGGDDVKAIKAEIKGRTGKGIHE